MELEQILTEQQIKDMTHLVKTAKGRKFLIDAISIEHDENWQCVGTPYDIVGEMLDLIPKDAENYIVFFALEFLEVLVKERTFDPEKILFVADNQIESDVANFYGCNAVILGKGTAINNENMTNTVNGANMKFGTLAVVGNPPYQIQSEAQQAREGGKQQAKPLYHLFVESVIDALNPDYFSFIIPSRWMVGGMGLDKFRDRMMNDRRMKKIVHFGGVRDVFPTVSITGGVNYFIWEKKHNGECEFVNGNTTTKRYLNSHDIILQDNNAVSILDKVMSSASKYINQTCYGNKPFGLATNFKDFKASGVMCVCQGKVEHNVDPTVFTDKHGIIGKWKVCTSKATSEGNINPDKTGAMAIATNFFIIEPNAICTETYVVVNVFDNKAEAENFISYMKTKFFRFMLGLRVLTQDINKEKFAWVPDVEDYSAPWTDKELYKKFGLTRQEQAYIESKIKAI